MDSSGKFKQRKYDFIFFKNDYINLKQSVAFNDSHFEFSIKTINQTQGFTILEFGKIYFDVFFEDEQVTKLVSKRYLGALLEAFKDIIFKDLDGTDLASLKSFFNESNSVYDGEQVSNSIYNMFIKEKCKKVIDKEREKDPE